MVGDIQYTLPGLFLANPYAGNVNAQLWTIPAELQCYAILSVLAVCGIVRRPRALLALVVGAVVVLSLRDAMTKFTTVRAGPTALLCVLCFLCGVALYVWRDRVPCSIRLFAGALAVSWACLSSVQTMYLAALPVAYATIWAGLQNPPKPGLLRHADYSYGLYLYHFPVEQAFYQLGARTWFTNLPLSLLVSWGAAALSWTFVESHVLDSRKVVLAALGRVTAPLRARAIVAKSWRHPSVRARSGIVSCVLLVLASALIFGAVKLAVGV
jgi:peptidoglycan/LPS O-acetylase OafA/YrhL